MNRWGKVILAIILFISVPAFAFNLCEELWSENYSAIERMNSLDRFTFHSAGPFELYPEKLGRVTMAKDVGIETGALAVATDKGYMFAGRPDTSKPPGENPFIASLFLKPFVSENSVIQSLDIQEGQRLGPQLVASNTGVKVVEPNGRIHDLPYSAKAHQAVWTDRGIVVFFSDRIRLYHSKLFNIISEVKSVSEFSAGAVHPTNGSDMVVADGNELVLISNFNTRKLIKVFDSRPKDIKWNTFGTAYYVTSKARLTVFDSEHTELISENLDSDVYSAEWDLSGQNLALSTFKSVRIYSVSDFTAKLLFSTDQNNAHSVTWFNRDNVLATVGEVKESGVRKWQLNFWDAVTGIELQTSLVISADDQYTPPRVLGIRGSIFDGSSRFYLLTELGLTFEILETLNFPNLNSVSGPRILN